MTKFYIVPIFIFIYILINIFSYLYTGQGICHTTGCGIASSIIKVDSMILNYLGLSLSIFLIVLNYLKKKDFYIAISISAFIIELSLLSFLFLKGEICVFCIGFFSLLSINLMIIYIDQFKKLSLIIPSIIFSILTFFMLINTPFVKTDLFLENGIYLFYSDSCPHCHKVMKHFEQSNISYIKMNIKDEGNKNVLKALNVTSIPVLIDRTNKDIKVLVGDERIIELYRNPTDHKIPDGVFDLSENSFDLRNNTFSMEENEIPEGCVIDKPSLCE